MSIGVVVATTDRPTLKKTIASIELQTVQADEIIVVHDDEKRGAPWARNYGARQLDTDWYVFSDDDIFWEPRAFEYMCNAIEPRYDIVYGSYGKGDRLHCVRRFDPEYLQKQNYISTMSMVRAIAFLEFDEKLKRLQDWDLWLSMVRCGSVGVHCGHMIFRTPQDNGGISSNGARDWKEAERIVKRKHGLK